MLQKYFTKETHKNVKVLIKTNAMSTSDFNPQGQNVIKRFATKEKKNYLIIVKNINNYKK